MKITKRKDGRYITSVQFDGKRKYFIGTDKAEVEARAIEYINYHNKGVELSGESILVSKLADEWFNLYQKKNAESTQKRIQGILDNYIKKELGHIQLKYLKTHHIQKMLNEIQEQHTDTTRKTFQIIKSILEFAVNNDYCIKNVAKPCTIKYFKSKERRILTKEEIKILEESDSKYRDFFVFILYTGLRRGEIAALKWSDVDFQAKEILVSDSMSFVTNKGKIKTTKTGKKRKIPILDKTLQILKCRKKKTNSLYVFSKRDGSNLSASAINKRHKSILKSTGLDFTPHELRHTFCTILYYAGVSSIHAAEIMGHSLAVMQKIYTHLDKDKSKEEVQKLNQYVSEN